MIKKKLEDRTSREIKDYVNSFIGCYDIPMNNKKFEKLINASKKHIEKDPNDFLAMYNIGALYKHNNVYDEAEKYLLMASEKGFFSALCILIGLYRDKKEYVKAIE